MAAYEPQNHQPQYGQPGYGQPAYGQPAYDQSGYYNQQQQQPAYGNDPYPPQQQLPPQPQADHVVYQPTPQPAATTGAAYTPPGDLNFGDQDSDSNKCQDWPFSIFFILQFIGMICLFGYYINEYRTMNIQYWQYSVRTTPGVIIVLFISLGVGAIVGLGFTLLIRKFPSKSIWLSVIGMICLYAGFGIWLIYKGAVLAGSLLLIFGCGFTALFLYCVRKRIKFSARLIKYSITAIFKSWGTFIIAFICFLISGLYTVWWIIGSLSLICVEFQKMVNIEGYDTANDASGKWIGIWIGLAFPLFLSTETVQNIVHFTVCGVTSAFWFTPGERKVTLSSFKRASIWSLGTVVFGSTITSGLRTARFALRAFANEGSILAACAHCILGCIERLVRFFNVYSFAWAATYGDNYCESSKNTMKLLKAKGFEVITNDELVGFVLSMCSLCSGAICAGIIGSFYYYVVEDNNVGPFFFAFICGYIGASIILQNIYSAVVATIVTWASAPEAMEANHNNEYKKLQKAKDKFYS